MTHLLPSEQKERAEKAIVEFKETGTFSIFEPCDCGSNIRHNNGGNYHTIIDLKYDSGQVFVRHDNTCELSPQSEWEVCQDPFSVIRQYADWL